MVLFPVLLSAQESTSFSRDIKLAKHLISLGDLDDAAFILGGYDGPILPSEKLDSLNFYTGLCHHCSKAYKRSGLYFEHVSTNSVFYHRSKYLQAFDLLREPQYDSAKAVLNRIDNKNIALLEELKMFELAGVSLLQRDHNSFHAISQKFTYSHPSLAVEQKNLLQYDLRLQGVKKKSPAVAGLMSAVVPGSGKLYSGKRAEAAAAFFQVALLGAMTYENYKQLGPRSPQFIVFGGLFTVFYVGNIYGSAISVKVKREELFNEIDDQVMLDLRLPIDRIFK